MAGTKHVWLTAVVLVGGLVGISIWYYSSVEIDGAGNTRLSSTLRIGVLPDESPERLHQRYDPLLDYLSEQLELSCELIIPESYGELLALFTEGKVDLGYFGGYTYVKARQQSGAVPLVMRRIDARFTSYFLVAGDSEAYSLQALRDKRIGFGSKLSTSGHLMPRYFLGQQNIVPETFFNRIEYSGAHDKTAYLVRDRRVDVGAANATTIRSMLEDGRLGEGDVRILWETPPYADYVWVMQPKFDSAARDGLRDAFLQLTPEIERYASILAGINAQGFIPADADFFDNLEQIATETDRLFESAPGQ